MKKVKITAWEVTINDKGVEMALVSRDQLVQLLKYVEYLEKSTTQKSDLENKVKELEYNLKIMVDDRDNYQHLYNEEEKRADQMQITANEYQVRGDQLLAGLESLRKECDMLRSE